FASLASGNEKRSISMHAPGLRPRLPKQLTPLPGRSLSQERNHRSGLVLLRARFGQSPSPRRQIPARRCDKECRPLPDGQHGLSGKSRQQPAQIREGKRETPLSRREIRPRAMEKYRAAARLGAGMDVVPENNDKIV